MWERVSITACVLLAVIARCHALGVVDIAQHANLTSFITAVATAGYNNKIGDAFRGTVFVPSNTAFSTFAASLNITEEVLLTNRAMMKHFLSYHMVDSRSLLRNSSPPLQTYETDLAGAYLTVYKSKYGPVRILFGELLLKGNGFDYDGFASILRANLLTDRSVMHVIDRVLTPPRGEI